MKQFSALYAVVLITIFSLSTSCDKEKTTKEPETIGYYIKFKVDGVQKQLTYTEGMRFITRFGTNSMNVEARADINPYPIFKFEFSNSKPIFNKNFTFTNKVSSDTLGFMKYNEGTSYNFEFTTVPAYDPRNINKDFVFTLTERTETLVRGTFSGTIYNEVAWPTVQSKKITEGSFNLNIKPQ